MIHVSYYHVVVPERQITQIKLHPTIRLHQRVSNPSHLARVHSTELNSHFEETGFICGHLSQVKIVACEQHPNVKVAFSTAAPTAIGTTVLAVAGATAILAAGANVLIAVALSITAALPAIIRTGAARLLRVTCTIRTEDAQPLVAGSSLNAFTAFIATPIVPALLTFATRHPGFQRLTVILVRMPIIVIVFVHAVCLAVFVEVGEALVRQLVTIIVLAITYFVGCLNAASFLAPAKAQALRCARRSSRFVRVGAVS